MNAHTASLREQLAAIAEHVHMMDVAISKMAKALDNADVCKEDINDHIVDMHVRLSTAHVMVDYFDECVFGLPSRNETD